MAPIPPALTRLLVQLFASFGGYFATTLFQAYQVALHKGLNDPNIRNTVGRSLEKTLLEMSLPEALEILTLEKLPKNQITEDVVIQRFNEQFQRNDPAKGGSSYLQAKILASKKKLLKDLIQKQQL